MGTNVGISSEQGIPNLLKDLEKLLVEDAPKNGDITFYIGQNEIPIRCHSIILKCRCKREKIEACRYPDMNPSTFTIFLHYLYTGKISIEEDRIFDLLIIAYEFGMEELEMICEDYLCQNLNPFTACYLLESAIFAKNKRQHSSTSTGNGLQQIIQRCVTFIGENPTECLTTTRCLSFPVETVIEIISSDQLCLEEEEVWRYCLRWAQFRAEVGTQPSNWSEDERARVSKFLTPVISHVRLLLIDSGVFAEEVEPTGCVPITLSLERYRFAALPHQFDSDPRLIPRNSKRPFNSSIIQSDKISLGRRLIEWFGDVKQSWRCIFRGSIHGFSADAFHDHCDGHSPTYVIALLQNKKWICGGFSDVIWTRSTKPRYVSSNRAFLFSFDPNTSQTKKFNVVRKHFAICQDTNCGPIFGAGADLSISSNCNENCDSYSNLPHSYENDEFSGHFQNDNQRFPLAPSYNFKIVEYEVFTPTNHFHNKN